MSDATNERNLNDAIELVARRAPAHLDDQAMHDGHDGSGQQPMRFDDDHEFVLKLPAWALREIKRHFMPKVGG